MNDNFLELETGLTRYAKGDPVVTTDEGPKETLRVYSVTLHVQGSDIDFAVETPLRYDAAGAERRPHDSADAHAEAFRRAVKLERACSTTSADTVFEMGPVTLLRTRLVAPRKPRN